MVHMFCTIKEAAEELNASQEQIESLLERGILHEYREGPHRLLKAAEVDVLAAARTGDSATSEQVCGHNAVASQPPRCAQGVGSAASEIRLPRSAAVAVRSSDGTIVRPPDTRPVQPSSIRAAEHRSGSSHVSRLPTSVRPVRHEPSQVVTQLAKETQDLSVREWLWAGLTQDHPAAIALLSGFALLALAALVAGMYMLGRVL